MAQFVVLAGFTDQGIRKVKETVSRAEAFKEMAKKSGVTVKDMYWTLGQYDVIAICEAPDDEAATALSLSVCSRGNVRSQTLRAFSFDEMKTILGKMVGGLVAQRIAGADPLAKTLPRSSLAVASFTLPFKSPVSFSRTRSGRKSA
jgi:uncharacterized protein with GYD domain